MIKKNKPFRGILSLLLLAACLLSGISGLVGCGGRKDDGKIRIVTTIFPIYDWVRNIVGENENVSIKMLVNSGVDLHSFQPSVDDIASISTCDLFLFVGGESDGWVDDALKNAINKKLTVMNLLEELGDGAKEEEIVEGMEGEMEEEEAAYDEHVWLSLKNAAFFCDKITEALSEIDSENAGTYQANNTAYKAELNALDADYKTATDSAAKKTLLFGDRFPFRYLVDDYGLSYYAAFVGCSAETEASFKTIVFLANKADELGLGSILTIEGSDGRIAETIKGNTKEKNQKILALNSLQSVTAKEADKGASYLEMMRQNLEVLKEAIK